MDVDTHSNKHEQDLNITQLPFPTDAMLKKWKADIKSQEQNIIQTH